MPEIVLPEVELNIYTPKDPVEATIAENYICSAEGSPNFVRHITFDITGTDLVDRVKVGQAVGILPPGEADNGRPHKLRLYSVSSPNEGEGGKRHLISTTVKRVVEEIDGSLYTGVCSNYMCDLKVGDKVRMTGPSGKRFLLPENKNDFNYLFFATGTGIAPFRGMIMELMKSGYNGNVTLIFGCPYRTDLLYKDFFEKMEEENSNFQYLKYISREDRREDGTKNYLHNAIKDQKSTLDPYLKSDNTLIYICGLKGMESSIYHHLALQGYPEYLVLKGDLLEKSPEDWEWEEIKKLIKPSPRIFEEVY
ncbi:FAD-binding oxidoreductase [Balneola sp. MJW-20]|uniref:FAD-binding oxidoreductase n=1 Tax=Gracilimonas aurantiaca TaxID=3234185 RepID=UPI00346705E7